MLSIGHAIAMAALLAVSQPAAEEIRGPLRVHPGNPRYFTDDGSRALLLVGSHTWSNLQDIGDTDPFPTFDWGAYLEFLTAHHHNFVRLWRWELMNCAPHPWPRTGPEAALDGRPRFDLAQFDDTYFSRLRSRVASAAERGVFVSVMLFEGWGMQFAEDAWRAHPFHPENNMNGIDGDANGDGRGLEVHELVDPEVLAIQEAYVRKVIDTVGDLDNVLYEISNENHPESTEWQYHMINYIREYERSRPKQHPIGMTFQYQGGSNETLFASPADWISPNAEGGYRDAPPANDGRKVILSDTDHLWGLGGNVAWVWKSVCRGMNPLFMDPYDADSLAPGSQWEPVRQALGAARLMSERVDLAALTPRDDLASTTYCLAQPGREYLVYLPDGEAATVDLSDGRGSFRVEWMHPTQGTLTMGEPVAGGGPCTLTAPFDGDAVVRVWRQ